MTPDPAPTGSHIELQQLHQRARAALQLGREADAVGLWTQIVSLAPDDLAARSGLGRWALRQGDLEAALEHFGLVARADGRDPRQWIHLATVHQRRGDAVAEEEALYQALKADPQDLLALLMRAELYESQGRRIAAAEACIAVTLVAPPMERLSPELRPRVAHAAQVRRAHEQRLAAFIDSRLDAAFREHAGDDLERFRLSLDIMLGRKRRYESRPMRHFMPSLLPVEFFDRARFAWMDAIEAGTEAIREEFLAVWRDDQGFTPYIEYGLDQPVEQWAELNHNMRWSCYHLWKDGKPVHEHAARCPETMRLLADTPRPDQPGRTPVAMYSLLKPRTAIPPHVGATNARLVCHLPLIVPPGCSFRVGNTVREWVPGRAWAFDDTIEHEARNDSDALRVVLIWDTWHPDLTEPERQMITAMSAALHAFGGEDTGYAA